MKIPETLLCTKCKKDLPLRAFHFSRAGKQKIHRTKQCNACRHKAPPVNKDAKSEYIMYPVNSEAKSWYLSVLWQITEIGFLWPHELDYECRRRYDTFSGQSWAQLKACFDILDRPTDAEQEAIIHLHLHREAENDLWNIWLNN